jgi:hypothetical protein
MAIPLPPLNLTFAGRAESGIGMDGSAWDFGQGDWNVNLAGSGVSLQSGSIPWLWIAAAGAAWLIMRR